MVQVQFGHGSDSGCGVTSEPNQLASSGVIPLRGSGCCLGAPARGAAAPASGTKSLKAASVTMTFDGFVGAAFVQTSASTSARHALFSQAFLSALHIATR